MRSDDSLEQARLAGARRRALDEGREPPPDPAPAAPPHANAGAGAGARARPSVVPDLGADGIDVPAGGAPSGAAGDTTATALPTPAAARGPWFDARAFFLGWLAMIAALIAGASGLLVAAAGFGVAYLLARRSRLANAAVSVAGATIAAVLAVAVLFVAALVFAG
ncbi:MAG: hypothetical protein EA416_16420 [Trueperaceae bacterium]|nr:MAG: hypothetical protein EA416_16420 [Trueperaceae bacterium]